MSKRNYKKLLKKQSNLYKNRANAEESNFSNFVMHEETCEKFEDFELVDLPTPTLNLREKLKQWYIETSPSRKCLAKLLTVMEEEGLDVPLSAAELLGKNNQISIRKMFPGSCHNCEEVSQQFHSYRESSERQFNTLLEILAEHKVLLDRIVSQNAVVSNIINIFPITSEDKLKELDVLLTTQADTYIRQIKKLLDGNAERNLHQIFGHAIIMDFNVDGTFGKKRLRDYANVFEVMIDAISSFTDSSDKCLRAAFQRQKKKYFKQSSRSKATKNDENNADFAE